MSHARLSAIAIATAIATTISMGALIVTRSRRSRDGALQAPEAYRARRLRNELFFSAPQLKRDSLCCPPPTANYLWNTTAPTSADSGSEFQPSRGVVTCQDPSDVPPGAS